LLKKNITNINGEKREHIKYCTLNPDLNHDIRTIYKIILVDDDGIVGITRIHIPNVIWICAQDQCHSD
jgi:hypothetical protein